MRIGIFVAMAGRRGGGPETYEVNLLRSLADLGHSHEFHVFCADQAAVRAFALDRANVRYHILWPRVRAVSYATSLPYKLSRERLPVLHATFVPPPFSPQPYVLTVHDVGMFSHPEFYDWRRLTRLRILLRKGIRRAGLLICPSETTRDCVEELFAIPSDRIAIIHHGITDKFRPSSPEQIQSVLEKFAIRDRYVLFTGKLIRYKNVIRLLEAFHQFRRSVGEDVKLVITGRRAWTLEGLDETIDRLGLAAHLRELGYVDLDDLPALYGGAEMLVFPSLYEGFGLPVIEAMACGAPVVTSNISCLHEVAGGAAFEVDPFSTESIADGITRVWTDRTLRTNLIARGLERARSFSWQRTAVETLKAYERFAG